MIKLRKSLWYQDQICFHLCRELYFERYARAISQRGSLSANITINLATYCSNFAASSVGPIRHTGALSIKKLLSESREKAVDLVGPVSNPEQPRRCCFRPPSFFFLAAPLPSQNLNRYMMEMPTPWVAAKRSLCQLIHLTKKVHIFIHFSCFMLGTFI